MVGGKSRIRHAIPSRVPRKQSQMTAVARGTHVRRARHCVGALCTVRPPCPPTTPSLLMPWPATVHVCSRVPRHQPRLYNLDRNRRRFAPIPRIKAAAPRTLLRLARQTGIPLSLRTRSPRFQSTLQFPNRHRKTRPQRASIPYRRRKLLAPNHRRPHPTLRRRAFRCAPRP